MAKTIGLEQLSRKSYTIIEGLPDDVRASLGDVEDCFDAICYGKSGNGKTNLIISLVKNIILALNCRAEYVSYEEGHGKTIRDAMILRHNLLEEIGNRLVITDHLTFEQLYKRMGSKQSAKVWVIDSLQASHLSFEQCEELKRRYVLGRKRKIIIYVSWADGKLPQGAVAKAVEYYANIKMAVDRFVMWPKSRFGGNLPYIIWREGARARRTAKEWKALLPMVKPPKKQTIHNPQKKEHENSTCTTII